MYYSDICYTLKDDRFHHVVQHDFALFAVWKAGEPYLEDVRQRIGECFEIVLETRVVWSEKHFEANAARLYEASYFVNEGAPSAEGHRKKIGGRSFTVFVVRDSAPEYTYARSVSGKIELSNLNVVRVKYALRGLISERTGEKYAVHSTNSLQEFFFQAPLIFGAETFQKILKSEPISLEVMEKDLEGASGWSDYAELFQILNYTTNYLVLRGFETLPSYNPEADLDVLTQNYQRFASAVGAAQKRALPFKGSILVGGKSVQLDMRYVGDNYYDPVWSSEMLQTKVLRQGLYVPRRDHYFFSLLYHAKVQKPSVKTIYYDVLEKLARELNFEWFDRRDLDDDAQMASLLKGYMAAEDFHYEDPLDGYVHKHAPVIQALPKPIHYTATHTLKTHLKRRVRQALPEPLVPLVKKVLRR